MFRRLFGRKANILDLEGQEFAAALKAANAAEVAAVKAAHKAALEAEKASFEAAKAAYKG